LQTLSSRQANGRKGRGAEVNHLAGFGAEPPLEYSLWRAGDWSVVADTRGLIKQPLHDQVWIFTALAFAGRLQDR